MSQNFAAIRALGFDTIALSLPDPDGWPSGHGGGFSYDPGNKSTARPEFAIAQEIAVRIADANHLKVIFSVAFSPYRFSTDGRPEWEGLADEYGSTSYPRGAYSFIRGLIEPNVFYGLQETTKLETIGLANGSTRSYVGDNRVIGWELSGEWNRLVVNGESGVATQERGFQKYWNYFYNLVHDHGAQNAFAGTYLIGSPNSGSSASQQLENIKAFKQWFAPGTGIIQPDLIGIEFYGGGEAGAYDMSAELQSLDEMINAMGTTDSRFIGDFNIPMHKIYLAEGNAVGTENPDVNQYFQNIFQLLTDRGLSGIKFFVSDSLADKSIDGKPTLSVVLPAFDLFSTTYRTAGRAKYPSSLEPGVAWHWGPKPGGTYADPTEYQSSKENIESSYGQWNYGQPTDLGVWVQQAIFSHSDGRNLRFYAQPNPAPRSGEARLYFDLSHMPGVNTIAVRVGTASGELLAPDIIVSNIRSLPVAVSRSGSSDFILIDTTAGAQKILGQVTVVAR